jgi:peptide chain release factor subunit 1
LNIKVLEALKMEKTAKEKYEFKKLLKKLSGLKGQGTELVSIYIPPGYNINEVTAKLRDEYGQAGNIKSKQTRKNVQTAIERLMHALKHFRKPPPNGLVLFCGNLSREAGGDKVELFTLEPPEPIQIQTYKCDSEFFLEPLEWMLLPKETYGLMTIDRREATFALLKGKNIELVRNMGSMVPGKHRAGGQSSVRFERLIEQAAHEFFKKVGDMANSTFGDRNVRGIMVGGPGPTKHDFLKGNYLKTDISNKVLGTVDTSYTDDFGIKEMVDKAGEIVKGLEVVHEKELVNVFFKEASIGNLATYGEAEVRKSLENGQVETLMISEGIDMKRIGLECSHCGYRGKKALAGDKEPPEKCPKCGLDVEVSGEEEDIVENLSELAEQTGAKLEFISTDTTEGEQFLQGFRGIGAILRFR